MKPPEEKKPTAGSSLIDLPDFINGGTNEAKGDNIKLTSAVAAKAAPKSSWDNFSLSPTQHPSTGLAGLSLNMIPEAKSAPSMIPGNVSVGMNSGSSDPFAEISAQVIFEH